MNLEKLYVDSQIEEILIKYNEEFLASGSLQYFIPSNFKFDDFNIKSI